MYIGEEEICLTERESKFIEAICSSNLVTWREISIYIYGHYTKYSRYTLYIIKTRLMKKIKDLDIRIVHNHGIILKDLVYIE